MVARQIVDFDTPGCPSNAPIVPDVDALGSHRSAATGSASRNGPHAGASMLPGSLTPNRHRRVTTGMAPRCKLLSCKVLRDDRVGDTAALLAALQYIEELNDEGRDLQVDGVIGRVHNLRADRFIGSHNAVTGGQLAYALLSGIMTPAS